MTANITFAEKKTTTITEATAAAATITKQKAM